MAAIDESYDDPADAVRGADLVILCTPVGLFSQILHQLTPHLAQGTIVTDVGSTKRSVVETAQKILQQLQKILRNLRPNNRSRRRRKSRLQRKWY